jgi:hypothetical protein
MSSNPVNYEQEMNHFLSQAWTQTWNTKASVKVDLDIYTYLPVCLCVA